MTSKPEEYPPPPPYTYGTDGQPSAAYYYGAQPPVNNVNYGWNDPTNGGYNDPETLALKSEPVPPQESNGTTGHGDGFTTAERFADDTVRRTFIRKVYGVLTVQLIFTFAVVCVFTFVDDVRLWVHRHYGFFILSFVVFLVVYLVIACVESLRRKHPINIIMLILLTLSLSYMAGAIASYYSTLSVVVCIAITLGVCIGVVIFSAQTKFQFTACVGVVYVLTLTILIFAFIAIFTFWWISDVLIGLLVATLLVLWLAIDTQLICGGTRHDLTPEEYIFAVTSLYTDIIFIFLICLSLCGRP
ncbi:protein lifeguard 2-like [Saccoglossus kowalevskii]|uniref:Lifeguard 1/2-like protein n=1 Tax=Saccoglossus kowalevskii TaxID=10224 RepID=A0A1C9TA38_SACKO|nr:PREDICTED: protein lifeguard 2-like [Saccoglossus kowalevskii]AOR07009.1 lifeguard 1/2-like protein [Saccoglossus kowalevskii]